MRSKYSIILGGGSVVYINDLFLWIHYFSRKSLQGGSESSAKFPEFTTEVHWDGNVIVDACMSQ